MFQNVAVLIAESNLINKKLIKIKKRKIYIEKVNIFFVIINSKNFNTNLFFYL